MTTEVFGWLSPGGPIHRITYAPGVRTGDVVDEAGTACGRALRNARTTTVRPEMDPYECWTTNWWPCAQCFQEFDNATRKRLRSDDDGSTAYYDATWAEVMRRRVAPGQVGAFDGESTEGTR